MSQPTIRTAHPTEARALTGTVVAAFTDLAICQWLAPQARPRHGVLTGYFRILVTHLLEHGHVEVIDGESVPLAVAGWLPANAPTMPPDYAEQLARAAGLWAVRFHALDEELARAHPHGHRHLVFLAVFPRLKARAWAADCSLITSTTSTPGAFPPLWKPPAPVRSPSTPGTASCPRADTSTSQPIPMP